MSATGRLSFDYWSMTRTYRRDFRALPFCDPRSSGRPLSTLPLSGVAAEPHRGTRLDLSRQIFGNQIRAVTAELAKLAEVHCF